MKGRLDKVLATCTLISRTDAQNALKAGRVTVDGAAVRDGKINVDSDAQTILLDGRPVEGDGFVYLMLYKPVGVLSATEDKKGATTAMDLLPEEYRKAAPGVVGRLDKDAEGLLLLTSNHPVQLVRMALDLAQAPCGQAVPGDAGHSRHGGGCAGLPGAHGSGGLHHPACGAGTAGGRTDLYGHPPGGKIPPDQADVCPSGQDGTDPQTTGHRPAEAG